MNNSIQYVSNDAINRIKWDHTINNAPNGFIYSRYFFLNALCNWDALIMGDYEYVMPLPYKIKWGIAYLYTPYFVGQLGIISVRSVSETIVHDFILAIPKKFRYVDIVLNEYNPVGNLALAIIEKRNNYILPLQNTYHEIEKHFLKDAKKNLRQAARNHLITEEGIAVQTVIDLFKSAYGGLNQAIDEQLYASFAIACKEAIAAGLGFTMALKDNRGAVVCAAFFGKDEKRIYYICGAPNSAGRQMNATHVMIDAVIKKYSGSHYTLDFEGSDIPSVANFYKKFSPLQKKYPHIKMNRLPLWLKWIKK